MPPTAVPSELWGHFSMPSKVDVDCLLPNALFVNISCSRDTSLNELRTLIWQEASKFPDYDDLKMPDNYVFVSVNQEAKSIEYYDYSKRLCDLKLFYLFFKLVEAEGNLEEKLINSNISKAIGLYVNEIDHSKDIELVEFRMQLFLLLRTILDDKVSSTATEMIEQIYTPYLEIDPTLLEVGITGACNSLNLFTFNGGEQKETIQIDVHVKETGQAATVYGLSVPPEWTPMAVICEIIKAKLDSFKKSSEEVEEIVSQYKSAYMLNVCGCDEIFHGDKCRISSYQVIQKQAFIS